MKNEIKQLIHIIPFVVLTLMIAFFAEVRCNVMELHGEKDIYMCKER